jgi:hypothetical protein
MFMQSIVKLPPVNGISDDSKPTFNIVVVYEDFMTGKRAKETCDYLTENLTADCQVYNQMWKFEVLSIPKLREMAVNDALQADVVIVSCRGGDELPEAVRAWIQAWLERAPEAIALVGLFDCPPEQSERIRKYLSGAVRGSDIEFFAQPHDWPGDASDIIERIPLPEASQCSGNNHGLHRDVSVSVGRWNSNA